MLFRLRAYIIFSYLWHVLHDTCQFHLLNVKNKNDFINDYFKAGVVVICFQNVYYQKLEEAYQISTYMQ